jgi:hypothetical protein
MDIGSFFGGGGIVAVILALGGGVKWWVGRQDARKDPIPKDAAAVALSASAVEVMQTVTAEMRAEMSELRAELSGVRGANRATETRLTAAESTIQHHEHLFGAALSYIEALLRHIRDGKPWPPSPAPADLRDLIDPALHD